MTSRHLFIVCGAVACAVLAGCNGATSQPPPTGAAAQRTDPANAGVVAGPIGQQLSAADRAIAGKAQYAAITDGKRLSWKGKNGSFGYITLGPATAGFRGTCRDYTHTIYINGRPQKGKGSACQAAPGQWRIVS